MPRVPHSCRHVAVRAGVIVCAAVILLIPFRTGAQDVQKRRGFSVKITNPLPGDIAVGKVRITAEVEAERPDLVEKVEFYIGDMLIFRDTEPPWECTWDFGPESVSRVVRVVATHREGVTVSDVSVTRKIDLSFAVRVNRVILNAVVTDKRGHFVRDLGPEDLVVREEGSVRPIIDFTLETRPLSVALLLDTSGSMQEDIGQAREAASDFVGTLNDGDSAMVIDFADSVFLLQDLTGDRDAVRDSIRSVSAVGATAIYDAVHAALRKMRGFEGRKAMVLLSDGGDTDSQFTRDRVVEEARAADVAIYSIGLGSNGLDLSAKRLLKEFSEATGGQAYFPKKGDELLDVYRAITDDLRSQYYLTYESANQTWDGRWVPIEVTTRNPDYEVRARQGYLAVKRSS